MAKPRKTIITCAVTGAIHTPSMSEYLPVSASEIAEAAVGAVGVLATLVGVKYGKVAAAGAVAVGAILLKKLGFVLFVLPVLLFKRIVRFFRGTPSV